MKKVAILMMLGALLSACGEYKPVSSKCFDASGRAICKFKPLPELHAKGGVSV